MMKILYIFSPQFPYFDEFADGIPMYVKQPPDSGITQLFR